MRINPYVEIRLVKVGDIPDPGDRIVVVDQETWDEVSIPRRDWPNLLTTLGHLMGNTVVVEL